MRAGADDFLTKPVATDVLLGAGERAILRDRQGGAERAHLDVLHARVSALTPSQRQVFDLLARGKLNKQIGLHLGTAERTIKWHRHNLMRKLQIQSLAELVSIAERLGLVSGHDRDELE